MESAFQTEGIIGIKIQRQKDVKNILAGLLSHFCGTTEE